jgi:hypothetical protein
VRLAVISDTHLDEPTDWFRQIFARHLLPAEALIHCGDITGKAVLDFLSHNHPNFHAVAGNTCAWQTAQELPAMLRLCLGGREVGVTHGWGDRGHVPAKVYEAFGPGLDLILFGHTHRQFKMLFGQTLLVNPGSLCPDGEQNPCLAFIDMGKDIVVEFRRLPPAV